MVFSSWDRASRPHIFNRTEQEIIWCIRKWEVFRLADKQPSVVKSDSRDNFEDPRRPKKFKEQILEVTLGNVQQTIIRV